ncbi:MAG TPA: hypothetical protein VLZ51_02420, partial [Brevundimonas sp.]|nr:hypothetical protein [Brevundimonas sp.]
LKGPRLADLLTLDDPASVVRGAAVWALSRLDAERFSSLREVRLAREADETVRAEWSFSP